MNVRVCLLQINDDSNEKKGEKMGKNEIFLCKKKDFICECFGGRLKILERILRNF
jgi:hypothetical protein